jgi:hypothetical protein
VIWLRKNRNIFANGAGQKIDRPTDLPVGQISRPIDRSSNSEIVCSAFARSPTDPRNNSSPDRLAANRQGDSAMSDDTPPFVYEGLDPVPKPRPTAEKVSDAVKDTVDRVGNAIDAGRKPGMPLSILSNITREAPLGSLLVAFMLGVAFARRR